MARFGSKGSTDTAETPEVTEDQPVEWSEPEPITPQEDAPPAAAETEQEATSKRSYTRLPDTPGHLLTAHEVSDAEKLPLRTHTRSEDQLRVDAEVRDLYEKWVSAGKPGIEMSPRKQFSVPPEYVENTRKMLEKADKFLNVNVTVATGAPNSWGEVPVQFTARDRVARKRSQ